MGFFIKKSVSVGPLRFNISKSGIGVSTGFKGFRIGTGPRGNYVQIGANGVYYRKSFPIQSDLRKNNQEHISDSFNPTPSDISHTHSEFLSIETNNFLTLHDATQDDLVKELNEKSKFPEYWLYGLIVLIVLDILYFSTNVNLLIIILINIFSIAGIYYLFLLTELNKSTVIMYDFTDVKASKKYQDLIDSINRINTSEMKWLLQSKAQVFDSKYHAGAGHLVNRKLFNIVKGTDRYIKTNIDVYALKLDYKVMYFFPDRLILKVNNKYSVISYKNIDLQVNDYTFIESEKVPSDGKIIDRTWQYVNKKGGPDKRFKNNKELPILKYEMLTMTSKSGLHEQLVFSKLGNSNYFKNSINKIE